MLRRLGKRAQTTAEYAILIAIVVGAIVAMQVYVRRGLQGRVRDVVDDVTVGGSVENPTLVENIFTTNQYEPYYMRSETASSTARSEREALGQAGIFGRALGEQTVQRREQVMGWDDSDAATNQTVTNAVAPDMPALPDVPHGDEP